MYAPNFRKSDLSKRFGEFGRPCRGLSPGKGFAQKKKRLDMACRDDKQYFIDTTLGQIEREELTNFSARRCSKSEVFEDFSGSCGQILVVAQFKIISGQGGSASNDPVYRKICLGVELGLRSFGFSPKISEK